MAVIKLEIICSQCGETFTHRKKCNNRSEADNYEEWAVNNITICPSCFGENKRASAAAEAKETLDSNEVALPAFTEGSEKQIAWATAIRDKAVANFISLFNSRNAPIPVDFYEKLNEKTFAKWWIDNREVEQNVRALVKLLELKKPEN